MPKFIFRFAAFQKKRGQKTFCAQPPKGRKNVKKGQKLPRGLDASFGENSACNIKAMMLS
jgi:hypothetical protein